MMRPANFCPRCGSPMAMIPRRDRLRPTCTQCGYVFYMNPVVAAGALVEENGRVLLVRRGIEPGYGMWGLPAGYVEADESTEEAAIRETREETGLEVVLDDLLDVYSFGEDDRPRGVLTLYAAHVIGGNLVAGDDASEACFFSSVELPPESQIAFSTHRRALSDWRRAHAIQVRLATESEAQTIIEMSRSHGEVADDRILSPKMPGLWLLVATDGDRPVGFAAMQIETARWEAHIHLLFVLPAFRRWGIGTHLVNAAIQHARASGMMSLLTEVRAANVGMVVYLKAGFHISGYRTRLKPAADPPLEASLFLTYDLTAGKTPGFSPPARILST